MLDKLGSRIRDSYDGNRNESPRRYMDYGLSALKEKDEKEDIGENMNIKIKDSEERIEMLLGIIESLATDKDDKKNKNKKHVQPQKNTRRKLLERNRKDDASDKTSLMNRKIPESKKGDYTELTLKTEGYPASSYQNLSTRISTNATNITVLPSIQNQNAFAASPINFKGKNILSKSLANSSLLRSNIRKDTNISGIPLPIGSLASPKQIKKEIENKKLKFNLNLNIDISNSDKQDLINIITDENINNFTTNLAINSNNNPKENSIISQTHSIIIAENTDRSNNYNNNKNSESNSNLFLTKIDENNVNNTKYSRFRNNVGAKANDGNAQGSSTNLQRENTNKTNIGNNDKEKLIHDFSIIKNNNKEKENQMFSGSNLINLVSPKNNQNINSNNGNIYNNNDLLNKQTKNYNLTETTQNDSNNNNNNNKFSNKNLINRLDTNLNEINSQSRTRIKGVLSTNSNSILGKNNINFSPSNIKANSVSKNAFSGNSQIKENYDGESEVSSPRRGKKSNKSYFDILDLISKDYNLTEVTVPSQTAKKKGKSKIGREGLYRDNSLTNSNYIINNNYNSDLNNLQIPKRSSENNLNSVISSEDIFSSNNNYNYNSNNNLEKFNHRDKDSFENFLSPRALNGSSATSAKKQDLRIKSKEFLDKFLYKCTTQENNLERQVKRIKSELKKDIYTLKTEKADFNRANTINQINREIDKNVYLMDYKDENRDKILLLLGSETKDGKKKIFIENRSSPLFVGELISKINDEFAFKCRSFLLDKFDNPVEAHKKHLHQYKGIQEYLDNQARLNVKHKQIEKILFDVESCKNFSMRRIANTIAQNNGNNVIHDKEGKDDDNEDD